MSVTILTSCKQTKKDQFQLTYNEIFELKKDENISKFIESYGLSLTNNGQGYKEYSSQNKNVFLFVTEWSISIDIVNLEWTNYNKVHNILKENFKVNELDKEEIIRKGNIDSLVVATEYFDESISIGILEGKDDGNNYYGIVIQR